MKQHTSLLSRIQSPEILRTLTDEQLPRLAAELREEIINVVSTNGGHLASNLGTVDLTIALHSAFESPKDKLIWDVGHQCYTHKLLTGRQERFYTIRQKDGLSGFPKRSESRHDVLDTGHSSTSLSAGLGILVGQQLLGKEGRVVAVIGDGALTGGMAFEALNNIGHLQKDLIIILNDNNMSIAPNVGALSSYLSRLIATNFYQDIRNKIDSTIKGIPYFGLKLFHMVARLKKGLKAVFFKENIFADLGFEYVGPIDGHNIPLMISVFKNVKQLHKPIVVHVVTKKGKGYEHAEGDPALYHGVSPFSIVDGKIDKKDALTFTEAFSKSLLHHAENDKRIVAITAAMTKGTGLSLFETRYPDRFFDVGITEQHAVTFGTGLALSGMKPVVALYSTFIQRAIDQFIHDVALQKQPVVFALDRAGLVGSDGDTHQGVYDVPLLRSIPGVTITAPGSMEDMEQLFDYGVKLETPFVIRYPRDVCLSFPETSSPVEAGRGVFLRKDGNRTLLIGVGALLSQTINAADRLSREKTGTDVYDLRFIKPLDEDYLLQVLSSYQTVFCFEDGAEQGGIGEHIMQLCKKHRLPVDFRCRGVPDTFVEHATRSQLLSACGLDGASLALYVQSVLHEQGRGKQFHLIEKAAES